MRFKYEPYQDQSVGTIAELLLQSGQLRSDQAVRLAEIAANAQLQQGNAAAQAAATRGNIAGQTIGGISNILAAIPGNIEARKRTALAAQEMELRKQDLQMRVDASKKAQSDRDLFTRAQEPQMPGGGPDDSAFAPPPGPPPAAMPPGGGPNDAEFDPGDPLAQLPGLPPEAPPAAPAPPPARPQVAVAPTPDQVRARLPLDLQGQYDKMLADRAKAQADLKEAEEKSRSLAAEHVGTMAATIARNGYKQMDFMLGLDTAESLGYITTAEKQAIKLRVTDRPDQLKSVVDQLVAASKGGREIMDKAADADKWQAGTPGGTLFQPSTGALGATIPKDAPVKPDYTIGNQRFSGATNQPLATGPRTATSTAQDWVIRNGLVTPIQPGTARPGDIPTNATAAAAATAEPLDASADVRTTTSGGKYLDLSQYAAGKERSAARAWASANGVMPVSAASADALGEIDTARANQKAIITQIQDLLPRDAAGRIVASATVPLSTYFQTDDTRAAFASWRTAAINSMRATAGSKGLRINKSEIEQAVENDIPKLTDTLGAARQKVANINTLLDNAERSILQRDHSVDAPTPPPAAAGPKEGDTMSPIVKDGKTYPGTAAVFRNGEWVRTK